VLLKNAGGSLPLDGTVGSIAVVGPSGLDALYVMGGSASVPLEEDRVVTPLAGLQARAAERVRVAVAQGSLGDAPLPDVLRRSSRHRIVAVPVSSWWCPTRTSRESSGSAERFSRRCRSSVRPRE
jgi:hypothetical protein